MRSLGCPIIWGYGEGYHRTSYQASKRSMKPLHVSGDTDRRMTTTTVTMDSLHQLLEIRENSPVASIRSSSISNPPPQKIFPKQTPSTRRTEPSKILTTRTRSHVKMSYSGSRYRPSGRQVAAPDDSRSRRKPSHPFHVYHPYHPYHFHFPKPLQITH